MARKGPRTPPGRSRRPGSRQSAARVRVGIERWRRYPGRQDRRSTTTPTRPRERGARTRMRPTPPTESTGSTDDHATAESPPVPSAVRDPRARWPFAHLSGSRYRATVGRAVAGAPFLVDQRAAGTTSPSRSAILRATRTPEERAPSIHPRKAKQQCSPAKCNRPPTPLVRSGPATVTCPGAATE